jgi:hypothetical protein
VGNAAQADEAPASHDPVAQAQVLVQGSGEMEAGPSMVAVGEERLG